MGRNIVYCMFAVLLFFTGCVMPESIKLGDQFLLDQDYIQAIESYEAGLTQITEKSSRQEVEIKLIEARKGLTDEYLAKAAAIQQHQEGGILTALENATGLLSQAEQYQDKEQRISKALAQYKMEKTQINSALAGKQKKALELQGKYEFDWAMQLVNSGLEIDPGSKDLLDLKRNLVILKERLEEIKKDFAEGNQKQAIAMLDQLNSLSTVPFSRDALPAEIKEAMALFYFQQALSAEKNNDRFKGYLLVKKAILLDSKHQDIFSLHRDLSDFVSNSMISNIAVGSFESPSNDPDAGKQFSDSLISYLYGVLPYGINILERDNIDDVRNEQRNRDEEIAKLLGLDLMVMGTVSLFRVEKNIDERGATVKMKIGEKTVINPEFEQMIKLHGVDQATWPSTPPKTLNKEIFDFIQYKKGRARLTGFAKVSFRIFDIDKGAISFVKDIAASVKHTSDFQDEVEEAGIEYIPMQLPTTIEVKEEMRKQVVEQIGTIVASAFESREVRFLNKVNFLLERRENQAAYEPVAKGMSYCEKAALEKNNRACTQLQQLADQLLQ